MKLNDLQEMKGNVDELHSKNVKRYKKMRLFGTLGYASAIMSVIGSVVWQFSAGVVNIIGGAMFGVGFLAMGGLLFANATLSSNDNEASDNLKDKYSKYIDKSLESKYAYEKSGEIAEKLGSEVNNYLKLTNNE